MNDPSWWSAGDTGSGSPGKPPAPGYPPGGRGMAWNRPRMERNRLLILLSGGGIGLLLVMLSTVGPGSPAELMVGIAACIAFFVVLLAGFVGYGRSARVQPESQRSDHVVQRLEMLMLGAFLAGVVLCILVALAAGLAFLRTASEESDSSGRFETSATAPADPIAAPDGAAAGCAAGRSLSSTDAG